MLCSHCLINDSSSYPHTTIYLSVMLQASRRNAKVIKSQKGHIYSHDRLQTLHTVNFGLHMSQDFPGRV